MKITVDPTVAPRFYQPRPVAYTLRSKGVQELSRFEKQGVISPVKFSDWDAAPIVLDVKMDGTIRVCGDYKVTVQPSRDGRQISTSKDWTHKRACLNTTACHLECRLHPLFSNESSKVFYKEFLLWLPTLFYHWQD